MKTKTTKTTKFYAVCNANGPISVRLPGTTLDEALTAFDKATDGAIDAARTDAEDDLGIRNADRDSEDEFSTRLIARGGRVVADMAVVENYHGGTQAHVEGGWEIWEMPQPVKKAVARPVWTAKVHGEGVDLVVEASSASAAAMAYVAGGEYEPGGEVEVWVASGTTPAPEDFRRHMVKLPDAE